MIQIEQATIAKFIYHPFKIEDTQNHVNKTLYEYKNDQEQEVLNKIFLKPFLSSYATHQFTHEINLDYNPLYNIAESIHSDSDFIQNSELIYKHLKSVSKHPNIKDGDLFIIQFEGIIFNNKTYKALGIYKSENKENFITTKHNSSANSTISFKKGIGSKKLEKGCLILFTDKPYTILIIDNAKIETDYWQNEFIKLQLKKDNVNDTSQFLTITKTFVTQQFPEEFDTNKADQIDLLNRSVEYFKNHENFDKIEFENEVLQQSEIINSFQNFDKTYRQENQIDIQDQFSISTQALKKQERVFKSVLKLDKNFHIYIHGNRQLIEQGTEKDGRKYYKIYYDDES